MGEPTIIVNGVTLTRAQSMAVRVAVSSMLSEVRDPEEAAALGPIAAGYEARLAEVEELMLKE